jgi:hypothetical protein
MSQKLVYTTSRRRMRDIGKLTVPTLGVLTRSLTFEYNVHSTKNCGSWAKASVTSNKASAWATTGSADPNSQTCTNAFRQAHYVVGCPHLCPWMQVVSKGIALFCQVPTNPWRKAASTMCRVKWSFGLLVLFEAIFDRVYVEHHVNDRKELALALRRVYLDAWSAL